MIELLIFGFALVLIIFFGGMVVWLCKPSNWCYHSYERIDTCNDEKMILVCRRCGKIRKLKK